MSSTRTRRPNVLLIITDQQYAEAMSNAGNADVHTPALDAIARDGVRFDSAYCTFPLCTPSRASLFTGRMPHEVGVTANVQPLPDDGRRREMGWVFRDAGYETAYAGKWHLPKQTMDEGHGFEVLCGMDDPLATRRCVEFLRRPHDKPFLLVTSYFQPHGCCPYHRYPDPRECVRLGLGHYGAPSLPGAAEDFDWPADAYEESFLERCPALPTNFAPASPEPELVAAKRVQARDIPPERRPAFWAPQEEFNAARNWSDATYRHYRWAYYRLVEWVDGQVGRALAALEESGQADNTLVVFTSDHGDMMGAHRLVAKNFFYEESVRVPLLMRFPGAPAAGGRTCDALVSNGLDLLPTLCDVAGIDTPDGLAGRSLKPMLEGRTPRNWRDQLVIEVSPEMGSGRMVHTGRWKYASYRSGDRREELYDLRNDPGELHNLAGDPAYGDQRAEGRRRLSEWRIATSDLQSTSESPE